MIDQMKLDYWRERLRKARIEGQDRHVSIQIVPDTLEWFLDTIDFLQGKQP